jgi:hypothetical protein
VISVVALYAAVRSYTVADRVIAGSSGDDGGDPPHADPRRAGRILLRARQDQLVAVPVLLALIPPFVSQAGALGSIFASRTASSSRSVSSRPAGCPRSRRW